MLRHIAFVSVMLTAACVGPGEDQQAQPLQAAPYFPGDTANHAEFASDVSVWETPLAQSQMDCFWDSGIRHVIVGTQDALVAHQQLAMAVARGMTVDAYVYIYWDTDITAQVNAAFDMVQGYPVGRMWLDIEQATSTLGANTLIPRIQAGLDACNARAPGTCGIYTSPGWWQTYVANTATFADVPLWYALYNKKRSLSDWSTEHFGAWTAPVGKQFQTAPLCDVGGADWDILQVSATPTVVVDRTLPADTGMPPDAPGELWPANGMVIPVDYVKLMSATVPRGTQYQLALERYTGTTWSSYYTWSTANAYVKAYPPATPALYRFRARAQNSHGWGAWSDYVSFDYGTYTGPRPSDGGGGGSPPPPPPGVPGNLSPNGTTITGASVTLSASAVDNATSYQFAIDYNPGGTWTPYYTYTGTTPSRTFYPQTRGVDYRFRVAALVGGAWGAWSDYATFHVQ